MLAQLGIERRLLIFRYFILISWFALTLSLFAPDALNFKIGARVDIFWGLMALLPVFLMTAGHEAWRRICPLSLISMLPLYLGLHRRSNNSLSSFDTRPVLGPESWIIKNRLLIQFGLLLSGIFVRYNFTADSPKYLALLILVVMLMALTVGALYGGRTWCHAFCPVSPVQKVFSSPGGLFESQAHTTDAPLKKSMCRITTQAGEVSTCIRCINPCPDIDLEENHWQSEDVRGNRLSYYGYLGIFIAIGSGLWQHSAIANFGYPVWLNWIAVVFLIVALTYISIRLIEYLILYRLPMPQTKRPILAHRIKISLAWLCLNLFYGVVVKIEGIKPEYISMTALFISSIWYFRAFNRSKVQYDFEVDGIRSRRELITMNSDLEDILGPSSLDDLDAKQVLILSKVMPEFRRVERRRLHRAYIDQFFPHIKRLGISAEPLLAGVGKAVGLTEQEHQILLIEAQNSEHADRAMDDGISIKVSNFVSKVQTLLDQKLQVLQTVRATLDDAALLESIHTFEKVFALNHSDLHSLFRHVEQQKESAFAIGTQALCDVALHVWYEDALIAAIGETEPTLRRIIASRLRRRIFAGIRNAIEVLGKLGENSESEQLVDMLLAHAPHQTNSYLQRNHSKGDRLDLSRVSPRLLVRMSTGVNIDQTSHAESKLANKISQILNSSPVDEKDILVILTAQVDPFLSSASLSYLATIDPSLARNLAFDLLKKPELNQLLADTCQHFLGANSALEKQKNWIKNSILGKTILLRNVPAFANLDIEWIATIAKVATFVNLAHDEEYVIDDDTEPQFLCVLSGSLVFDDMQTKDNLVVNQLCIVSGMSKFDDGIDRTSTVPRINLILATENDTQFALIRHSEFEQVFSGHGTFWISTLDHILKRLHPDLKGIRAGLRVDISVGRTTSDDIPALIGTIEEIHNNYMTLALSDELNYSNAIGLDTPLIISFKADETGLRFASVCKSVATWVPGQKIIRLSRPEQIYRYERRNDIRFPFKTTCRIVPHGMIGSTKFFVAITQDLSRGGMQLSFTDLSIKSFEDQLCDFSFQLGSSVFKGVGQLTLIQPMPNDRIVAAFVFTALDEEKRHRIEAYLLEKIANKSLLVQTERKLIEGWNGSRVFVVDKVVRETADVSSFYLKPNDSEPLPNFIPGQFLTLQIHVYNQTALCRCYSLSDIANGQYYRITVRRKTIPGGKNGLISNFLNEHLSIGDSVQVLAPAGGFYLDTASKAPVMLIAGGIGITPLLTMLKHIAHHSPERSVTLLYGVQNSDFHVFDQEILGLKRQFPMIKIRVFYEHPKSTDRLMHDYDERGIISLAAIKKVASRLDHLFYICGALPMMEGLEADLLRWGVAKSRIFWEAFSTSEKVADFKSYAPHGNVDFFGEKTAEWSSTDQSILSLSERNNIFIPSACRRGSCQTCRCMLLSGHVASIVEGKPEVLSEGIILTCCAAPIGNVRLGRI